MAPQRYFEALWPVCLLRILECGVTLGINRLLPYSAMLGTDPRARLELSPSEEIMRWLEGVGPRGGVTAVLGNGSVMVRRSEQNQERNQTSKTSS